MASPSGAFTTIEGPAGSPVAAPPWQRAGWLERASEWIGQTAAAAGIGRIDAIATHRMGRLSTVLRVATPQGRLFFKAVLVPAWHEVTLTALLSRRHPAHFPIVLGINPDQSWMLMREVAGDPLACTADPGVWRRAFETFARIQCDYVGCVEELFDAGCPDRTVTWLATNLERLVALFDMHAPITDAERRSLERVLPVWRRLCEEAAHAPIPPATLDHADLHAFNVMIDRGRCVYLDWTAGAVGHPFASALMLLEYMAHQVPAMRPAREAMRDAYLRPWTRFASMPVLVGGFERFRPLSSLKYGLLLSIILSQDTGVDEEASRDTRTALGVCARAALGAEAP